MNILDGYWIYFMDEYIGYIMDGYILPTASVLYICRHPRWMDGPADQVAAHQETRMQDSNYPIGC